MKKADMEYHYECYHALLNEACDFVKSMEIRKALGKAKESWQHIDGMMRYEKKARDRQLRSVASLDLIVRYAPLMFDQNCLDELESLLKASRRIERGAEKSVAAAIDDARTVMWDAYDIWNLLEHAPDITVQECSRRLSRPPKRLATILDTWEEIGIVREVGVGASKRFTLATRTGEIVSGKCTACGRVSDVPKALCFELTTCSHCSASVYLVILSDSALETEEG